MRSTSPESRGHALAAAPLLFAALALLPATAGADEAKELFQRGTAAYDAGDYGAASDAFRKAYSLRASWKMLFNIGQAEAAAKRYGLALEALEAYLVQGGDDIDQERRESVLSEIQRMRLVVGVLDVEADAGAELFVDGVSRGTAPFDGVKRVEAGTHRVEVRRGDVVLLDKTVSIAGGLTTSVDARAAAPAKSEPPADAPPAPIADEPDAAPKDDSAAPTPAPAKEKRTKLAAGLALGGVGLVSVGVGVAFAVKGGKDYDAYLAARDDDDRATFDDYEKNVLPRDRALTAVGFAAGGALLVTGIVLAALDGRERTRASEGAVSVRPGPGGLHVSF